MGRIFETRKHTMFARWDKMAKQFARIGKDITIAVKSGGPDPVANPQLRRVVETATDNPTRTVSNVRMHFNKGGGSMASTGSVAFQFKRMGVFRLNPDGI